MSFGEIKRNKSKVIAAGSRDQIRNFTAAISGVGRGVSKRKIKIEVKVFRAHGLGSTKKLAVYKRGAYVAEACTQRRCALARGGTPTRAVKAALVGLANQMK